MTHTFLVSGLPSLGWPKISTTESNTKKLQITIGVETKIFLKKIIKTGMVLVKYGSSF